MFGLLLRFLWGNLLLTKEHEFPYWLLASNTLFTPSNILFTFWFLKLDIFWSHLLWNHHVTQQETRPDKRHVHCSPEGHHTHVVSSFWSCFSCFCATCQYISLSFPFCLFQMPTAKERPSCIIEVLLSSDASEPLMRCLGPRDLRTLATCAGWGAPMHSCILSPSGLTWGKRANILTGK